MSARSTLRGELRRATVDLNDVPGPLAADQGGTGLAAYTIGDLLYANGPASLTRLAGVATGNVLLSGGVATAPAFGKVGLTTHISGTLGAANGGTGVANNAASTLTITGNFGITFTVAAGTALTLPAAGTVATLTGAEEFTNKTLNASVGKGTWTASGTWTLPAHTLGGTVSGGGNQINNVVIGTSSPLAGTFTTLTATGLCDLSGSGAGQIKFPATQNSSSDANTLDDYEEGDWTPTDNSGAGLSFTSPAGKYTKYGRDFRASCYLQYPATANGANASIAGLPFTVANTLEARQGFISNTSEATLARALPGSNATTFSLLTTAGGAITNATLSTDEVYATIFTHV